VSLPSPPFSTVDLRLRCQSLVVPSHPPQTNYRVTFLTFHLINPSPKQVLVTFKLFLFLSIPGEAPSRPLDFLFSNKCEFLPCARSPHSLLSSIFMGPPAKATLSLGLGKVIVFGFLRDALLHPLHLLFRNLLSYPLHVVLVLIIFLPTFTLFFL